MDPTYSVQQFKIMLNSNISISGKQYKICGIIGEGGAAIVYLAKDNRGDNYALKIVKNYKDPMIKQMVDAEIRIQKQFQGNKYVIQYIGYQQYLILCLEKQITKSTLFYNSANAHSEIGSMQLINVLCDVCQGLMSIHHKKIIHRDIKPENIIKKDNVYKITDFGVSCDREEDQSMTGTVLYWAPQILFQQTNTFTSKVDVWSFGVTVFQAYFKVNPFCPDKSLGVRQAIEQIKKNIKILTPKFTMAKFIDLLKQRKMTDQLALVQRKLKNTDKSLIQNLCLFFEPNPALRPDIDLLYVLFESLRNTIQMPQVKKTQKTSKFPKWQTIPEDIRLFCRAKDLFYELSAYYKTKLYDKALFGLELGIWYLQGANYGGINYIFLDKMNFIKDYRKPAVQLWAEVKNLLSEYYFYLKCQQQVRNFDKISQLRMHILICSVWWSIIKDDKYFCKTITNCTGLEIDYPMQMFSYLQMYSDKNVVEIEQKIISRYYV